MNQTINGVDRQALFDTIAAVKDKPELASFTFRVKNRWVGGGENRSTVDDFYGTSQEMRHAQPFELVNDEPSVLLSGDNGANPVEFVLHALAGCLTTTMVYHAAAKGIEIEAVRTRFEGDLDLRGFLGMSKDVRNGYSDIRVTFEIDGDLNDKERSELVAMGKAHSPVFDIVTQGVPVSCHVAGMGASGSHASAT